MKLRTATQLARLDDDDLLGYLSLLADELDEVNPRQTVLWEARIAVYREGRRRQIANARMAVAARVSETAISVKLKQLDEREEAAEAR